MKRTVGTLLMFCLCAASLAYYVSNTFNEVDAVPEPSSAGSAVAELRAATMAVPRPSGDAYRRLPAVTRMPFAFGE